MSSAAIQVTGLGKRYRLGSMHGPYRTLRESLMSAVSKPIRRFASRRVLSPAPTGDPPAPEVIWALKDISFEVEQGEVVGIIGRNGAGKSTLLKILSRITEPTEGCVKLHGRVGSLLEVGTGFHPELTGRENIYLNGAILGMRRAEINRKFDEMVAFAEVERFIDTPVKRYSSGMYVRLAFAVAAHLEPEILLVDEVLAVGDVAFQRKCLGKIGDVAREGRTVLFVSHQMYMIVRLCRQVALLDGGRLVRLDTASKVIEEYLAKGTDSIGGLIDLTSRPRPPHVMGGVRLLSAEVLSNTPAEYGSPLEMRFSFEVMKPVSYVEVSLIFKTMDGNHVSAVISGDSNGPVLKRPEVGNAYTVVAQVPECRWVPRLYSLAVGARSGPNDVEDLVEVGILEVVGNAEDPSCFEGRWDFYRPHINWEYLGHEAEEEGAGRRHA